MCGRGLRVPGANASLSVQAPEAGHAMENSQYMEKFELCKTLDALSMAQRELESC